MKDLLSRLESTSLCLMVFDFSPLPCEVHATTCGGMDVRSDLGTAILHQKTKDLRFNRFPTRLNRNFAVVI